MKLSEPMALDQAEMESIHAQSLRILVAAEVRVEGPECRDLLARAGARVDPDGEKVYLARQLSNISGRPAALLSAGWTREC